MYGWKWQGANAAAPAELTIASLMGCIHEACTRGAGPWLLRIVNETVDPGLKTAKGSHYVLPLPCVQCVVSTLTQRKVLNSLLPS